MEGQNKLQIGLLLKEYENRVAELQNELIKAVAYAKQLESQLEELKRNEDEFPKQIVIPNENNK